MIPILLQVCVVAGVGYYLALWRIRVRRRNEESWDSLMGRLRVDWSARELSDAFLWKEGIDATAEDAWKRMEGPKGLWVMFKNAGVMLEMADFAAKHSAGVDRLALETLRSDAMHIRLCVLMALTQYAFTYASEGVRVNAFRAASMYSGMAARMTSCSGSRGRMVPDFVAAM